MPVLNKCWEPPTLVDPLAGKTAMSVLTSLITTDSRSQMVEHGPKDSTVLPIYHLPDGPRVLNRRCEHDRLATMQDDGGTREAGVPQNK